MAKDKDLCKRILEIIEYSDYFFILLAILTVLVWFIVAILGELK